MKWTKERATCGKESCISFILCQHYNIRNCENAIMNQCQPESSQYQQCMSILHQSIMWCDSIKCKKKKIVLLLLFKISNAYFVASWINSSINLLTLKQVSQNIFIWFTVELSIFFPGPRQCKPYWQIWQLPSPGCAGRSLFWHRSRVWQRIHPRVPWSLLCISTFHNIFVFVVANYDRFSSVVASVWRFYPCDNHVAFLQARR